MKYIITKQVEAVTENGELIRTLKEYIWETDDIDEAKDAFSRVVYQKATEIRKGGQNGISKIDL